MIYIDIETIPDQTVGARDKIQAEAKPPANYKNADTIAKWREEHADELWRRTALDGTHGEVVCIGWKVPLRPAKVLQRDHERESEAEFLRNWIADVEDIDPLIPWIGHNVQFDLRFLWQRCVVNNVIRPFRIPRNAKPWHPEVFDTSYAWTGKEHGISLANLCAALDIPISNDDIKGGDVWDAICAGRLEDVVEHCRRDVERVRIIHKRMVPSSLPREGE